MFHATASGAPRPEVRLDTSLESLLERTSAPGIGQVLATVVATAGSTYRKPGARMLIMGDGSYVGLLSGGCLESDLAIHAQEVLHSGVSRAVEYDMRGADDTLYGIGAGCEGAMRILLEPLKAGSPAAAALSAAGRAAERGEPITLVLLHESADQGLGSYLADAPLPAALIDAAQQAHADRTSRTLEWGTGAQRGRAFLQFLMPPPHLLICGAGPDAQPVVSMARALGWRVSVVDHRPAFAVPEHFPGAAVRLSPAKSLRTAIDLTGCHAAVVMSHHLASDEAYLRELAESPMPGYVGLLGPPARRLRIIRELGPAAQPLRSRIRGPVGIDLGAVTPEGIALAVIAEIHAWLAGVA